ncbi:hypothetical protein EDB82DRAFT_544624 [Fusarium venenatum]|uniref:uncharacterized protein n=1 Tax=Fusarium venenatum TaxID=56646 RepID=UPI001D248E10|nr:hypothetical protein EDB82DRAFT_544624 [Fusarium venenatum]
MKKSRLEPDPDADALLTLKFPNLQQVRPVKEQDVLENVKAEPTPWEIFEGIEEEEEEEKEEAKGENPTDIDEVVSLQPYDENGNPNEIEFGVSTKQLYMASPVFDRMLKGNFQESKPDDEGLLEIRAQDWNARALLILLDIIHGHHRQVPRELDLDTVAHIALLVDYYDCLEIVEVFLDHWLVGIPQWWLYEWPMFSDYLARPFGEDEVLMLFIAWVFRRQKAFKNLTDCAIKTTFNPPETPLPIPSQVLGIISTTHHADRLLTLNS